MLVGVGICVCVYLSVGACLCDVRHADHREWSLREWSTVAIGMWTVNCNKMFG